MAAQFHVCFVCLGNICRSPTAEGIMLQKVQEAKLDHIIAVESAGTGAWHAGELPDPRSREAALRGGVKLVSRAQQFLATDFTRFDLVVAMDDENHKNLLAMAPNTQMRQKVVKLRHFDPSIKGAPDVPDPYFSGHGHSGFDTVFAMCAAACDGLLAHLRKQLGV